MGGHDTGAAEPDRDSIGGHDTGPAGYHRTMRVAFIAAECEPWAKTGGLGDVVDALARALGHIPAVRKRRSTCSCRATGR